MDNTSWIISNGSKINFWLEIWLMNLWPIVIKFMLSSRNISPLWLRIGWFIGPSAFLWISKLLFLVFWCWSLLYTFQNLRFKIILFVKILLMESWVRSRPMISYKNRILLLVGKIFRGIKNVPPSHSMMAWRLIHNKLPTNDNLSLRGFSITSMCSICNANLETSQHLFFDCKFVKNIWNWLLDKLQVTISMCNMRDCMIILQSS